MPGRLLPCRRGGCRELVRGGGLCEKHARAKRVQYEKTDAAKSARVRYDKQRGSAASRGYGAEHRRWAKQILSRDIICVCKGYGCDHAPGQCGHPAEHADHIDGDNQNRALDNGQGLCARCHGRKTLREQNRWRRS